MLTKRRWARILLVVLICFAYGVFVSVWDIWKLHDPHDIPREMAYLCGILALGLVMVSDIRRKHFRAVVLLGLTIGDLGCSVWLVAMGHHALVALAMFILAVLFALSLLSEIKKLKAGDV